ncbi:MAG: biotin--[acetyl-CoA-carboxylase] ligase [Candidatus Limivivens sp.]|nr:biotin--[acetyl-CoA-carboxylase] ligase [Candidatus Limivivens sp.]
MKSEILKILRQSDEFVSGQELCEHFGVSRTAVWKAINQLKAEGYQIEAVSNRGYHLVESPDILSEESIGSLLQTEWAGKKLYCLETVDSTNNYAKKLAEEGAPHGTLVLAERQEAGKGRRGRVWQTPKGTAIAMTILLRPDIRPEKASMLTLVMGLAVAKACREILELETQIKWPNDVVIRGKKICGILTEMSAEMLEIHYLVIGTGINVNMTEFPEELKTTATSLRLETGREVDRAKLAAVCMKHFENAYEIFRKTGDLSGLKAEYESMLVNRNQKVCVLEPGHEYTGTALGINDQGELLVETETGIRAVYAGEVSVRGVYGYV